MMARGVSLISNQLASLLAGSRAVKPIGRPRRARGFWRRLLRPLVLAGHIETLDRSLKIFEPLPDGLVASIMAAGSILAFDSLSGTQPPRAARLPCLSRLVLTNR